MRSFAVGFLALNLAAPALPAGVTRALPEPGRIERAAQPAIASRPVAPRTDAGAWSPDRAVTLATFDAQRLIAEDIRSAGALGLAPRIAVVRSIEHHPLDPAAQGQWSTRADGAHVWRLHVQSSEALSVRLHFTAFDIPEGGVLRVVGTDDHSPARAYTGKGPLGDGEFWSHTFDGASAWLEYVAPPDVTIAPIIEIGALLHTYRDPANERRTDERAALALLPCEEDVNCHEVDATIRDSVARITFISGGFAYLCSGGLIADTDVDTQIPWFITAHHCLSTEDEARTVEAFWFYQSARCKGPVPRVGAVPRTLGASLIYSTDETDFTLLRLSETPIDGQTYAGWSTDPVVSGDMIGVHHPGGSYKRVSFSSIPKAPFPGICISPTEFIYTRVNLGVTEPGSSGSPLFNTSGEVVGQLLGGCGDPDCNYNVNPDDIYGRFAVSYELGALDSYLNVQNGGDDDFEPNDSFLDAPGISLGEFELKCFDDDFFTLETEETGRLTITAATNNPSLDIDLTLLNPDSAILALAATGEPTERLRITGAAATYIIKVHRKSGGGTYRLTLALEPGLASDLDEDGIIGPSDILRILRQWGTFCPDLPVGTPCADINGDARVGQPDLEIALRDFGISRTTDERAWKRRIRSLYTNDIAPLIDLPRNERNRAKKLDLQRLQNAAP